MTDTPKIVTQHAINTEAVVRAAFERWRVEAECDTSQASIESFATQITKGGTEKYFGHGELEIILALGGKKPQFW